MADEEKKQQTPREIMDKLYAMTPEEVNRFLGEHFKRMISRPPSSQKSGEA